MKGALFADGQDLLKQRRLERGLPAEPLVVPTARALLLLGGSIGGAFLVLVVVAWSLVSVRDRLVTNEIARMSGVPGQLQKLESQLRTERAKLDELSKSNQSLAQGLVAVSSGSALITQLAQLTPKGVQITSATVNGQTLALKGRSDDPGAFTRVNALSLLLAYAPLFNPGDVRVIKLLREDPPADGKTRPVAQSITWELGVGIAALKPTEQLPVLRKLGADGMAKRLQDLARMGMIP